MTFGFAFKPIRNGDCNIEFNFLHVAAGYVRGFVPYRIDGSGCIGFQPINRVFDFF